ncbi:hypothetical protein M413DRAFT_340988 [Hebeloma cylindrosporum]|uniref:Uncharacterized protein n=1 Tax=Hebeloma cylindrosporum TaxID=76867 RepID=A0A0C3C9D9_HEBCY|nr:hypothetical protein M413DRAFT_340988 [Hebeloma cylindrosporum h7]
MKLLCEYLGGRIHNRQKRAQWERVVSLGDSAVFFFRGFRNSLVGKSIPGGRSSDPIAPTTSRVDDHRRRVLDCGSKGRHSGIVVTGRREKPKTSAYPPLFRADYR